MELLSVGNDESTLNLSRLPEQDREKFQSDKIIKAAVDLLRVADNTSKIQEFVSHVMKDFTVLNSGLKEELEDLSIVTNPMNLDHSSEVLQLARDRMKTVTSRRLHKAMTLFPTGMGLLDGVDKALEQRTKDADLARDLEVGASLIAVFWRKLLPTAWSRARLWRFQSWLHGRPCLRSALA